MLGHIKINICKVRPATQQVEKFCRNIRTKFYKLRRDCIVLLSKLFCRDVESAGRVQPSVDLFAARPALPCVILT